MGVPVPERIPGDCYVWGSSEAAAGGKSAISSPVPGWQHSNLPTLVENTTHLDVLQVSTEAHQDAHPTMLGHTAVHSLLCMAHRSAVHILQQGTPPQQGVTGSLLGHWAKCDMLAPNWVKLFKLGLSASVFSRCCWLA